MISSFKRLCLLKAGREGSGIWKKISQLYSDTHLLRKIDFQISGRYRL